MLTIAHAFTALCNVPRVRETLYCRAIRRRYTAICATARRSMRSERKSPSDSAAANTAGSIAAVPTT